MSAFFGKVKWLFSEIKTHWNTPAEGKYVPYKEYKDVILAVGSNYAGSKVLEYIGFFSSCYLIMHHYKLPSFPQGKLCQQSYYYSLLLT